MCVFGALMENPNLNTRFLRGTTLFDVGVPFSKSNSRKKGALYYSGAIREPRIARFSFQRPAPSCKRLGKGSRKARSVGFRV